MRGSVAVMTSLFLFLIVFSSLLLFAASGSDASTPAPKSTLQPPKAHVDSVVDDVHGVKVADPYRWLEDAHSPAMQKFVSEQLAYTRSVLDALPGRDKLHAHLEELLEIGNVTAPKSRGGRYFYTRREGTQNQPVLYVREGVNGKDRVLVDVNQQAADGTIALDWFFPSHDGKYVAYGTSPSGSEISTLHVIDVATGHLLQDTIERTRAASLQWKPDGSGFYYTRYPKPGEVPAGQEMYNRHVFYHVLGSDPPKDPPIFGAGRDAQDWPNLELSNDGRWLSITVEQGWAKSEVYLKDTKTNAQPVAVAARQPHLYDGKPFRDRLYIMTNEGAPMFRLFVTDAAQPERKNWREIIPESDSVLKDFRIVGGQIVAEYEQDAISHVKVFALDGKPIDEIKLPTLGKVAGVQGEATGEEAFIEFQSYAVPPTILRYEVASKETSEWAKVKAPIDSNQYDVKQVWFNSKDGTRVPMFIVSKKGLTLNGKNPTLLTGYGGFNLSRTPSFERAIFIWLEHGGVYADANLRGGSEFGEKWHAAGMLGNKQNVFDDFAAAAEYLIAQKYTDTDHLSIRGRSNGGLLMGAALTQHPELYKAVVCQVPLLDMLRYQNFQIAKLWIPEYGSADDPEQFKWLYAYSPYHHVVDGTKYPATLIMTADTDTRVDPMHAKKMAARLQAANAGPNPILLEVDTKAGHGLDKPIGKQVQEWTDIWSFLFWQLGVKE
jgi:prolyl oligopeptidase